MQVVVTEVAHPTKPARLADVSIELTDEHGNRINIHDVHILQNKHGEPWVALPTHSQAVAGKERFQYKQTVEMGMQLFRQVEAAILAAYAEWRAAQDSARAGVR